MIVLAFSSKESSLISKAIRWVTRWKHSHVAIVSPDGQWVCESTGDQFWDEKISGFRDGVRLVGIHEHLAKRDDVELRELEHPYPSLAWEHAVSMVGARYDGGYAWGWLFGDPDMQDIEKFSCDELVREAMRRAGRDPFPADVKQTSPRDFYLCSTPLKE